MKTSTARESQAVETHDFTREEHLRVQREIEARAHRLWLGGGGNRHDALQNWLQAESEVLAEFARGRMERPVAPAVTGDAPAKTRRISHFPAAAIWEHWPSATLWKFFSPQPASV